LITPCELTPIPFFSLLLRFWLLLLGSSDLSSPPLLLFPVTVLNESLFEDDDCGGIETDSDEFCIELKVCVVMNSAMEEDENCNCNEFV
jgi:hypothetical protein